MQNKRIRTFVIACVTCCSMAGCKHTLDDPLARGWEKGGVAPAENAPILQQAAESPCVWVTANETGKIRITDQHKARITGQEVRLQTSAGTLIGTNKGEYAGNLSLVGTNGTPIRPLLAENVLQLLPVKAGALVFTGLLHLSVENGAVWLFYKSHSGDWSIRKLADLDGTPRAVYENNGSVLVVTGHGISRVDQSLGVKEIASLPFAQTLPNSVAEDAQGRIYVGMNAFVVRFVPTDTGYVSEWFTKPGCLR
jgi:hypothetical protein